MIEPNEAHRVHKRDLPRIFNIFYNTVKFLRRKKYALSEDDFPDMSRYDLLLRGMADIPSGLKGRLSSSKNLEQLLTIAAEEVSVKMPGRNEGEYEESNLTELSEILLRDAQEGYRILMGEEYVVEIGPEQLYDYTEFYYHAQKVEKAILDNCIEGMEAFFTYFAANGDDSR